MSIFNGDVFTDVPAEDRFIRALQTHSVGVRARERPVVYQRGNHEYRGAFARDAWEVALQGAPITLAICGHTHLAEICPAGSEGNPYPVAIGGGSREEDATVMHLEGDPSRLTLKMFDTEGQMIQSLSIP